MLTENYCLLNFAMTYTRNAMTSELMNNCFLLFSEGSRRRPQAAKNKESYRLSFLDSLLANLRSLLYFSSMTMMKQ